jgi:hypothetical protein
MIWTMLIVIVAGGVLSSNATFQTIPFQNKEACVAAASSMRAGSSKSVGYLCVSSETGEIIRFVD